MDNQKDDWNDAMPQVYNCYTIIRDTEDLASRYRLKAEKCNIIAAMLENSVKGKTSFMTKLITDNRLVKEIQSIGIKVENYGSEHKISWNPEDLMKFISTKN